MEQEVPTNKLVYMAKVGKDWVKRYFFATNVVNFFEDKFTF